jgi:hypothetical protein
MTFVVMLIACIALFALGWFLPPLFVLVFSGALCALCLFKLIES